MTDLTAELAVEGRVPQTPALAPNGQLLCYVLAPTSRIGDHLDTALWLADIEDDGVWRRATADAATESRPRWSADSRTLYFLSDRAERGTPQAHRLTRTDDVVIALTGWRAGIIDHLPLADPDLVALLAEDEPTEQDTRRAQDRDDAIVVDEREPRARLRLLDLRTGQLTTPSVFDDRHVVELRQRPDGGPLAVLTQAGADKDYGPRTGRLHLFDPTTGTAEDLRPVEAEAHSLAWWPAEDGWHVGYIALTPPVLQAGTAVFDLAMGSRLRRNRTADLTMCPTELHQTDAAPLIVFADSLNTTLARLDPDGPSPLAQHPGRLDTLTTTPAGTAIAALTGTRYQPTNVHVGPPTGPLRKITDTRPDLDGIAGGSHGGFMAAWAIGQTDRFRAALVLAGVVDWGMLAATGENGQFEAALGGSTGWNGIGPHPHDAVSPVSFASRVRTPVLILHGARDTNVPLGQAVYFHRALRHFGAEHEFVIYPREGHSIRERNHQVDILRRTHAWFDRWL